jgi:hypothetical protein
MNRCKKLLLIPAVATEWQQAIFCPDCDHYDDGVCSNPTLTNEGWPCPFDNKALPLRAPAVEPIQGEKHRAVELVSLPDPDNHVRDAGLEQAVEAQVLKRTGGRIKMLQTEVTPSRVVVRGVTPCYYLKQLALQGALDVIGSLRKMRVQLEIQVMANQ